MVLRFYLIHWVSIDSAVNRLLRTRVGFLLRRRHRRCEKRDIRLVVRLDIRGAQDNSGVYPGNCLTCGDVGCKSTVGLEFREPGVAFRWPDQLETFDERLT